MSAVRTTTRGSNWTADRDRSPSLVRLAGLEVGKTVTTRSGQFLLATAALAPMAGTIALLAFGQDIPGARQLLSAMCTLVAVLLLAVGILSTAGEWAHRSVESTFLVVPRRGRVLAAKYSAAAVVGAAITAVVAATTLAVAAVAAGNGFDWADTGTAVALAVGSGAVMCATGAGVGAAIANTPAALAGTLVTLLVALPLVGTAQPALGDWVDPLTAMSNLITIHSTVGSALVLAGWAAACTVAGVAVTQRKGVT